MTNKETVPVLLRDNRQEQSDALLYVISFEYLVLLLIFRDGLYASPCTESRKRGGKEGNFRWLSRDSLRARLERSLNFWGRQMAVSNNLFELSPLPDLVVFFLL